MGVLPEKLTGLQLVRKFCVFYGTLKVHYRIHSSSLPVPILSEIDPAYASISRLEDLF
jgi:hypothetical protein